MVVGFCGRVGAVLSFELFSGGQVRWFGIMVRWWEVFRMTRSVCET